MGRARLGVVAALAVLAAARPVVAAPRPYEGPAEVEVGELEPAQAPAGPEASDDAVPEPPAPAVAASSDPAVAEDATDAPAEPDDPETSAVEPENTSGFVRRGDPLLRHRLVARTLIAGRVNPLGFVVESSVGYRRQLVMRDTKLFRDSYLLVGAYGFLTPALARIGPTLEIQPAAVVQFGATYGFVGTFGTFSQTLSYPSATADWGPTHLRRDARAGRTYATSGHLVTLHNILQARVGRVAMRSTLRAYWGTLRLRDGDRVYYDRAIDMMLPARGWSLTHDFDLLYAFDFGLRLVLRNTVTHAFYHQRDFYPGQATSQPNGPTARVGPGVAYTFFDRGRARFNRPTLIVLAQWWYAHRFRTGADLSAGIPMVVIGFAFDADILPTPARRRPERRTPPAAGRPAARERVAAPRLERHGGHAAQSNLTGPPAQEPR